MPTETILITGACGQLGTELTPALADRFGTNRTIATDLPSMASRMPEGIRFEALDITDKNALAHAFAKHKPTQVYHLAAILSANGEQNPALAQKINYQGYLNILDACLEHKVAKLYFPSTIAVFGPNTPKENTPQHCIMDATTMYGITKHMGERMSQYYNLKYGLDVRSLRYPGIISYKAQPGGGTTDYAVDIFHKAIEQQSFQCYLKEYRVLPMMYIDDAVGATLQIMDAPASHIKIRSSYNLAAFSFSPAELAEAIKFRIPEFVMTYAPDFRDEIAATWPGSIDDSYARKDWGWQHRFDLNEMVDEMLHHLQAIH